MRDQYFALRDQSLLELDEVQRKFEMEVIIWFYLREKIISKKPKLKLTNVLKSISICSNHLLKTGENHKNNLKKELKNLELKGCKFIQVLRKKCKMIFRTYKNVMKKWKPFINSILKNLIITWKFSSKKERKIIQIMKNLRKKNVFWTLNWEI